MIQPIPCRAFLNKNAVYVFPDGKLYALTHYENFGLSQKLTYTEINTKTWELSNKQFRCTGSDMFEFPYLPVEDLKYKISNLGVIYTPWDRQKEAFQCV